MRLTRTRSRLDPAQLRLPLIALIDVVLFLLMYFMFAGSLAAEEQQLAAALRTSGGGGTGRTSNLQAQIVRVEAVDGRTVFGIGERTVATGRELAEILRMLPKESGVIVKVSGAVSVEAAAEALQACHDAGFDRISYAPAK